MCGKQREAKNNNNNFYLKNILKFIINIKCFLLDRNYISRFNDNNYCVCPVDWKLGTRYTK